MRCVRCNRPISAAAAIVPSAGQPFFRYGPKCARLAGLIEPKARASRVRVLSVVPAEPDPNQLVLGI